MKPGGAFKPGSSFHLPTALSADEGGIRVATGVPSLRDGSPRASNGQNGRAVEKLRRHNEPATKRARAAIVHVPRKRKWCCPMKQKGLQQQAREDEDTWHAEALAVI